MSRTINMTAGNDNEIIWLVKISRGSDTWKFATENITLSSNDWDGEALSIVQNRFSLNEIGKRINVPDGGTLGEISTVAFQFTRYTDNTFINDFFNEFYPATSGKILVAMDVEVGVAWDGATAESDITWLYKYKVEEYEYDDQDIYLICSEFSDFDYFNLPYYEVQNDFDNGISYYPEAPKENLGKTLPIVYGRMFQSEALRPYVLGFIPLVRVEAKKFIIATHEMYDNIGSTGDDRLFEEIPEY